MGKIHMAAAKGDLATVKKLVESGEYFFSSSVPVDTVGEYIKSENRICYNGTTALDCAIHYGHLDVIRYLHEKGATKFLQSSIGTSVLECIYGYNNDKYNRYNKNHAKTDVVKYIIQHYPVTKSAINEAFNTAISNLDLDFMKYFINEVAADLVDNDSLFQSIYGIGFGPPKKKAIPVAKWLISQYAAANKLTYSYVFIRIANISNDWREFSQEIYDSFIDSWCQVQSKANASILKACELDDRFFLQRCVAKGILKSDIIQDLLEHSVRKGSSTVVNLLVEKGADPCVRTKEGLSLLDLARKEGFDAIVKIMNPIFIAKEAEQKQQRETQKNKEREIQRQQELAADDLAATSVSERAEKLTLEAISIMPQVFKSETTMERYRNLLARALYANPKFLPALLAMRAVTYNGAHRNQMEEEIKHNSFHTETRAWFEKNKTSYPGVSYLFGNLLDIMDMRPQEVIVLYTEAAAQGIVQAKYGIAACYSNGSGNLQKDEKRGRELYIEASEEGFPVATEKAARCLIYGEGGPCDCTRGIRLAQKAADAGISHGYLLMGHGYKYHETKNRREPKEGFAMFKLALDAFQSDIDRYGHGEHSGDLAAAQLSIALYYFGLEGDKDLELVLQWAKKVIANEHARDITRKAAQELVTKIAEYKSACQSSSSSSYPKPQYRNPAYDRDGIPFGVKDAAARPTIYRK